MQFGAFKILTNPGDVIKFTSVENLKWVSFKFHPDQFIKLNLQTLSFVNQIYFGPWCVHRCTIQLTFTCVWATGAEPWHQPISGYFKINTGRQHVERSDKQSIMKSVAHCVMTDPRGSHKQEGGALSLNVKVNSDSHISLMWWSKRW